MRFKRDGIVLLDRREDSYQHRAVRFHSRAPDINLIADRELHRAFDIGAATPDFRTRRETIGADFVVEFRGDGVGLNSDQVASEALVWRNRNLRYASDAAKKNRTDKNELHKTDLFPGSRGCSERRV